jgi:Zn-dependent protease with chaperone function
VNTEPPITATGYRGSAFSPEASGRILSGRIEIGGGAVQFRSEQGSVSLPFAGLILRRGGHNGEQVFFEHPKFFGWSVYSSDEALIRDAELRSVPEFAQHLASAERIKKRIPFPVLVGLVFMGLIAVALIVLVLAKDRIIETIADKIPIAWEQSWGDQIFEGIKAQGKIVENTEWEAEVAKITSRLLPALTNSGYTFQFHIMQDTNVNAFAIPGGHVVILTGLLERADSAEEVAGVLAHEIAHLTKRHSMRGMMQSAGLVVLIQSIFGDTSGIVAILTQGSQFLIEQRFSRDFEREADDVGWNYLVRASIDTQGMIEFFEKLKKIVAASGMGQMESSLALLNTHPATQERVDRLNAKRAALKNSSAFVPIASWRKKQ